jgi:hypothetical protein
MSDATTQYYVATGNGLGNIYGSRYGYTPVDMSTINFAPYGAGTDYPDFDSYARANGWWKNTDAPAWQTQNNQAVANWTAPAYIAQMPSVGADYSKFSQARYGQPTQTTMNKGQVNPLLGNSVGLGQSILGGLK